MRNTNKLLTEVSLLTGVSAFALAATLASGAWAHHVDDNDANAGSVIGINNDNNLAIGFHSSNDGNMTVGDDGNNLRVSSGNAVIGGDAAFGTAEGNIGNHNDLSNIGQAVAGVWLAQVGVNEFSSVFSDESDLTTAIFAASISNVTFTGQIANQNNLNTAVNAFQQGAVTITVGVGSIGGTVTF